METTPHPPHSTRGKVVYFIWSNMPRFMLLFMIVLIVYLAFAVKSKDESIAAGKAAAISQEKPPVNTITLELSPSTISDRINLPGSIEPWTELQLLAKINGSITEVLVHEGARVQKGDVLALIEEADYRIALDRARAAYNQAKADFERDQSIYTKGMIPTAEIETRKTNMQTAKADLADAELQLSRCSITAPMDGVIKKLDAKVGLLLSVGDPIADILEIDRLKAVIGIPESDVNKIRKLDRIALTIQALGNETIYGTTHFISPSPDSVARLYMMELEIENNDGRILPGMFVRADIVKSRIDNAVTIPFYSVISRNDEQFVFVEQDGIVEKRNVRLGIMEKWLVQITEGLDFGDHLVVEGHRDVEDQQQVRVVKAATSLEDLKL
ncbi:MULTISPECIES: efflux RND transporter periplasmic adaptor subunit [Desulfosediminicola]|uniref:efflux RND transporter periplasmic adaptor subunit n=1 Tax=Desulfosediminicola TaxID=2886823 RepID=UPI0010AD8381|nr:efflux RND transporter periplasmic adaptor subunit [Desulfosediminicola ganghwensis]